MESESKVSNNPFGLGGLVYTVQKVLLWVFVYVLGYVHLDPRWLLLVLCIWYFLKMQLFTASAAIATDLSKAAKSKLLSKDLPAWVLHPDTQRAEWFNKILAQLWPHLDGYLKQVMKNVEDDTQLKERLVGYHIMALKFPHVSLGVVPPRLSGVKVHQSSHRDEVIMDVSLQYAGDVLIQMEAQLLDQRLPAATASIRNLSLASAQLRVHLRPLLTDVPFVGSVTVCFLQTPELDFDLGGVANALDLPGISLLLRHVIQDQLEQTMVMPNSFTVALVPENELADKKSKKRGDEVTSVALPAGVLTVHVVEAKGLENKDSKLLGQGKSDPYAVLKVSADGATHSFKTDTVNNNLHPSWRMVVDLPIDDPDSLDDLKLDVWDEDSGNDDDFLGRCVVASQVVRTAILSGGQTQDVWKVLEGVKRGSIHIEVGWAELKLACPLDQQHPVGQQQQQHQAVLSVVIDSCNHLLGGRTGLKLPNPKIKVELCNVVQYTDTVVGSVDPVFAHRMNFLVADPLCNNLNITVQDDRREEQLLGTLRVPLSDLMDRTGMSMSNTVFYLQTRSFSQGNLPQITMSMAMRYIYRPKTSSFGVHKSLQDLHKIMTSTVKTPLPKTEAAIKNGGHTATAHKDHKRSVSAMPTVQQQPLATSTPNNDSSSIRVLPTTSLTTPTFKLDPEEAREFVRTNSVPRRMKDMDTNNANDNQPKVRLSLKYSKKTATLSIVVHTIRNLHETSYSSLPSAYVKTRLLENTTPGRNHRVSNTKRKTKTQKHTASPVFEETLEYFLHPHELRVRRLEVTVCHDSRFSVLGRNVVLGRCLVNFDTVHAVAMGGGEGGGDDTTTVTEWHVLRPSANEPQVSRPKSLPRSVSGGSSTDGGGMTNTLPKQKKNTTRSASSKSSLDDIKS